MKWPEDDVTLLLKNARLLIAMDEERRQIADGGVFVRGNVIEAVGPTQESAALARSYGLRLHTHVAETRDEEHFCLEKFGRRPVEYMEELDWAGEDVWYAHAVHLSEAEIGLLAATGVAHYPTSNMRLGSGIAPIKEMLDAGVRVGLAVDGSASNGSSHMLAEVRQAMPLQRVRKGADALSAEQALEMATLGGAAVLGREDIGSLEPGKAADFIGISLDRLEYAGALHDPLAALLFCTPVGVDLSIIDGKVVVEEGRIVGLELGEVIAHHNQIAEEILKSDKNIQPTFRTTYPH